MRALAFTNSLAFSAKHPEPPINEGDTLLKVRQAGICATDLEIVKGYMDGECGAGMKKPEKRP